jgi:heterodisulfide reductase subunit C
MNNKDHLTVKSITLKNDLAELVQKESGQNVYLCCQCIKCASGCPVAEFFDWQPNQIMRALQLGQEDVALASQTPWLCASCQTRATRCPQGFDSAPIMDFLTREALEREYEPKVPEVDVFNQAFLRQVKLWKRNHELGMMAGMNLRTKIIFRNTDLGVRMVKKNKVAFLPNPVRPAGAIETMGN